jgi:hypothetical protein
LGVRHRGVGLRGDERFGLRRRHRLVEELVDGEQVHRQREDLALGGGLDTVVVRHHHTEAIDVLPHVLVSRVENVRPVHMDHDIAVLAFGVTVARHMIPRVEHVDPMTSLGQFASHHCTGKTGSYHCNMSGGTRHPPSLIMKRTAESF